MATPAYVLNAVDKELRTSAPDKQAVVVVQVTGTFVATLQFEGSLDGSTWVAVTLIPIPTGAGVTSATAPGMWTGDISGLEYFRVRCSAFTSGSPSVRQNTAVAG